MKTLFSTLWQKLRSSYWFIPSLLSIAATALSVLTVHVDTLINGEGRAPPAGLGGRTGRRA